MNTRFSVGSTGNMAGRIRDLLDENWRQTRWTRPQTEQVLRRMDPVLDQLPKARKQARHWILQGQLVPNREKILSLYEPDVHVIVRRKAGAGQEREPEYDLTRNNESVASRDHWPSVRSHAVRVWWAPTKGARGKSRIGEAGIEALNWCDQADRSGTTFADGGPKAMWTSCNRSSNR